MTRAQDVRPLSRTVTVRNRGACLSTLMLAILAVLAVFDLGALAVGELKDVGSCVHATGSAYASVSTNIYIGEYGGCSP